MSLAELQQNLARAEQQVESLVAKYLATGDAYHPKLSEILKTDTDYDTVWILLDHEAQLISQRPTGLALHEISIVQKAFLTLFAEENLMPAMNLYVCEILGLGDSDKTNEDITLSVQKRLYLMHELKESHRQESNATKVTHGAGTHSNPPKKHSTRKSKRSSVVNPSKEKEDSDQATEHAEAKQDEPKEDEPDEHLSRLLEKFQQAKQEFDSARSRSFQQTRSARFLRDTTENCLNYLRSKHAIDRESNTIPSDTEVSYNKDVVAELFHVLSEATRVAERGSGGKKRRFDMNEEERAAAAAAREAREAHQVHEVQEAHEAHEAREARHRRRDRRSAEDYYNDSRVEDCHSEGEVEEEDLNEEYDPRRPYLANPRHHKLDYWISPNYRGRNPRPPPARPAARPSVRISAHVAENEERERAYRASRHHHHHRRHRRTQRSASPPEDRSRNAGRSRDAPYVSARERDDTYSY